MTTVSALAHPVLSPNFDQLLDELLSDLDVHSYGFKWMQAAPALRILVSDYTLDAAFSCLGGLREASYHLQEYEDAMLQREQTFMAYAESLSTGQEPEPHDPPSFKVELEYLRRDTNVAGFFRAIGSSFDSLGVVICAIGGLSVSIIDRFTFPYLRGTSENMKNTLQIAEQITLLDAMNTALANAGPPGWDDWTSEMRNMLVHRPRRLWLGTMVPSVQNGRVHSVDVDFYLPKTPEWTDVEVWRGMADVGDTLLPDSATQTLIGIHTSVINFVEEMALALLTLVNCRRSNKDLISQPITQWRTTTIPKTPRSSPFAGYGTGQLPSSMKHMAAAGVDDLRMRSASVLNIREQQNWPNWLGQMETLRPKKGK